MLVFVACLIGGSCVELVTILHSEIGNFYHSQATIMMFGKREPLYMLMGCYGWIAYAAMVLSRKVPGGALAQASFAALLGSEMWALLDTVGAQLLWWTWHSSEPLYNDRESGVPVASSFWIMASMGSLALALRWCPSAHTGWGVIAGPAATLGLMHVPFTILFHPLVTLGGLHASYAMWLFRIICGGLLLRPTLGKALPRIELAAIDKWPILAFVICMSAFAILGDPLAETRRSFSQPCLSSNSKKCGSMEHSFWGGFERRAHVCAKTNVPAHDLYRLCDAACNTTKAPLETYAVCGVPKAADFVYVVLAHAVAVLVLACIAPADEGGAPRHTIVMSRKRTASTKAGTSRTATPTKKRPSSPSLSRPARRSTSPYARGRSPGRKAA